jgi:hypothetical protein
MQATVSRKQHTTFTEERPKMMSFREIDEQLPEREHGSDLGMGYLSTAISTDTHSKRT